MSRTGRYPPGLTALFLVEMWERFSYYGMRAILVLYLIDAVADGGLGLATAEAVAIYGIYTSAVYILALPGGWVADRFWGARRAILVGAVIIIVGHVLLAIAGSAVAVFMSGLACIAIGTGLLKPNISSMVGELYDKDDIGGRDAGFSFFYMGINVGAILGGFVAGYLGESWGWHWGFGAAAVAMLAGLLNFIHAGRGALQGKGARPPIHHHPDAASASFDHRATAALVGAAAVLILGLMLSGWLNLSSAEGIAGAMGVLIATVAIGFFLNIFLAGDLTADEKRRMVVLGILFLAAAVFWSRFEQAGSSLSIFAADLTDRQIGMFEVPASWFQNLNPAFIILLTPLFAAFWLMAQRRGWDISVFVKFGLALILVGVGFLLLVPAAKIAATGTKVSFLFLFGTFLIHTCAELLLSPVGLSTFSRLAPERFVSQMMGFWFLAASLGSLIAGLLASGMDTSTPSSLPALFNRLFWGSVAPGVLLILIARPLSRWAMLKNEASEPGKNAR
ncbi:peptide MFS transporter [Paracoccus sp. MBLB3053]|uniref:Peptide MFS transporter n=1 Tax=Paracoccus aurantius TaxID=3073814 RepID=A0ABU2HVX8_9RHOB|nr:peptide MFS transporter [Paracoccus sp. MBLB3053]MDS9469201.1 peptide MFS transporter [Paracoccus sp. MBLB3053]